MERIGNILPFDIGKSRFFKSKGFAMIPNWFIEDGSFSVYEKMTAIVIVKHQKNNKEAWPSQQKIAEQVCCSVSTVKKAISGLEDKGILISKRSSNHRSNVYKISFNKKNYPQHSR